MASNDYFSLFFSPSSLLLFASITPHVPGIIIFSNSSYNANTINAIRCNCTQKCTTITAHSLWLGDLKTSGISDLQVIALFTLKSSSEDRPKHGPTAG